MKFVDLYVVGGSRGGVCEAGWLDFFLLYSHSGWKLIMCHLKMALGSKSSAHFPARLCVCM